MKLICCILSFIVLTLSLSAQIVKNSLLIGGQVSSSNSEQNNSVNSNLVGKAATYGISFGKAVHDNRVVGIDLVYIPSTINQQGANSDTLSIKSNTYSIDVFYRQYKKLAKDLYFFSQLSLGVRFDNQFDSHPTYPYTTKSNQIAIPFSFTPGISYQVYKKMHLEITIPDLAMLQYSTTRQVNTQNMVQSVSKYNSFSITTTLTGRSFFLFGAGIRFIF